ncbi:unnamed protein product [Symbiodinium natans]|uniref:Uncharacterized protein n=1 Tax=Symbiodinium natans TaxID=878477 RepID=A0A812JGT5_9DINO|nr:unnamed protein product [Symbiodinium natans]
MALPDLEVWQLALFQAPVAQREGLKHLRASAGEAPRRAMLMALPGIDYLEGHDIDERMMKFLPKMCKKMEAYAGLQSKDEAPDKTVYKLNAHVRAFEKAVKNNDKAAALEAFKSYQNDMPRGLARFDIHDPMTFEGPKDVNVPKAAAAT